MPVPADASALGKEPSELVFGPTVPVTRVSLTSPALSDGTCSERLDLSDASDISADLTAWCDHSGGQAKHWQAARLALSRLEERYRDGGLPFLTALDTGPASHAYLDVARRFARDAELVVHVGCGGSMHAGRAFVVATGGGSSIRPDTRPSIAFAGSINPDECANLRETLNRFGQERVCCVFVSKSGRTTETLAHFAMLLDWYGEALTSEAISQRTVCMTQARSSPLRTLAEARGVPVLDVPSNVGGRFAAFTVTGLLPAAIGNDVSASGEPDVLAGGRGVLARAFPREGLSPAARSAAAMAAFHERHGTATLVTLAYESAMAPLQTWYRQLVAESLGKDSQGFTPVTAYGTDDEHSQLQLWLDGPPGQMFTLLRAPAALDLRIPADPAGYPGWFPRRLESLWTAHADATGASLSASGRPVRTFTFARRSQGAYGALMAHLMIETVLLADILGIDPFGQPAVEGTKERVVEILTRVEH